MRERREGKKGEQAGRQEWEGEKDRTRERESVVFFPKKTGESVVGYHREPMDVFQQLDTRLSIWWRTAFPL